MYDSQSMASYGYFYVSLSVVLEEDAFSLPGCAAIVFNNVAHGDVWYVVLQRCALDD